MNNTVLSIIGLALFAAIFTGLDLWRLYRKKKTTGWRHRAALQIDVPYGVGAGASIKFMGRELHGVASITFRVCAGGAAECVLHIHPSMVRIFADSIDLKLEKPDRWLEEGDEQIQERKKNE